MKIYTFGDENAPVLLLLPGTQIHIFYALKMGEKYRERYERHFAQPIIH